MKTIIEALLLKGETLEHIDDNENLLSIWKNERTGLFCLEKNAKVILTCKTFKTLNKRILGKSFKTI